MDGRRRGRTVLLLAFAGGAALSTVLKASPLYGATVPLLWPSARRVRSAPLLLPLLAALLGLCVGELRSPPPPAALAERVKGEGGKAFVWAYGRVSRAEPWTGGCRALLEIERIDRKGEVRPEAARAEAFLPVPHPSTGPPSRRACC